MYLYCEENVIFFLDILDLKVNFQVGESILIEIFCKFNLVFLLIEFEVKGLKVRKVWIDF